jgi:ABC-type multidrug transport system permease subunit
LIPLHSIAHDFSASASWSHHEQVLQRFVNVYDLRFNIHSLLPDIDTIDNTLIGMLVRLTFSADTQHRSLESMRMFAATASNIVGAIILVAVVLPWFLIAVFVVSIAYFFAASFYRASARELKVSRVVESVLAKSDTRVFV